MSRYKLLAFAVTALLGLFLAACNASTANPNPSTSGSVAAALTTPTAAPNDATAMNMEDNSTADAMNSSGAMQAMSSTKMAEGPHMKMTAPRTPTAADQAKLAQIEQAARTATEKYKDYRVAEADGFRQFLANVPQPMYHFTSAANSRIANTRFDATKPTSLMYKKVGSGYELMGVMYTAPANFSDDQLDARVPLSVGEWHQHVNICFPPRGTKDPTRFGLSGAIATQAACDAAGGKFYPRIFNWMVHIYPFTTNQ